MTPPTIFVLAVATAALLRVARRIKAHAAATCVLDKQLEAARDDGFVSGYMLGVQDRRRARSS